MDSDLIAVHAASANYRDLIIVKGQYPFAQRDGVVPLSDGAGTVEKVGKAVKQWKKGDRVMTLFNQTHQGGLITAEDNVTGVGGVVDGALREYGTYDQNGLVKMPESLDFIQAATLPCAGVTAWNALYGLEGRALKPGHWVVTQGTGGVSIFALQFAKAAGARVIATTSSAEKMETLKKLGADHVLNYRENPNW